jgi:hypothetical protein
MTSDATTSRSRRLRLGEALRLFPRRRGATLLLLPALVLVLAGCSGAVSTANFSGESQAVAQRIADFQSDVTGNEAKKLCDDDFAAAVRARLQAAGSTCKQALEKQLGSIDDYEVTVEAVAVKGATATARVKSTWSGKLRAGTVQLVKESGAWRITGLS